ncbi:unannotated protein [freshwater metagenome]|uniref:Unannotated protein n=1 Tax=freshwater metagenome TaxID=449393 RepID=A0A6J6RNQ9_9ZZZZ
MNVLGPRPIVADVAELVQPGPDAVVDEMAPAKVPRAIERGPIFPVIVADAVGVIDHTEGDVYDSATPTLPFDAADPNFAKPVPE